LDRHTDWVRDAKEFKAAIYDPIPSNTTVSAVCCTLALRWAVIHISGQYESKYGVENDFEGRHTHLIGIDQLLLEAQGHCWLFTNPKLSKEKCVHLIESLYKVSLPVVCQMYEQTIPMFIGAMTNIVAPTEIAKSPATKS
jgi:hypothetical protein